MGSGHAIKAAIQKYVTDETKRKMSISRQKRLPPSKSTIQKMSESRKGRKLMPASDETKRKISLANTGKKWVHLINDGLTERKAKRTIQLWKWAAKDDPVEL